MTGKITVGQEKALAELRQLLKDDIPENTYNDTVLLLKFLKAREFHVKQAESMIRKNLRWKKEMQVDTILTDFVAPEVLVKYAASSFLGYDKEGHVIRYIPIGRCDGKGLNKSVNAISSVKYFIQNVQEDVVLLEHKSKKLGKIVSQGIPIYDAAQLSLAAIMDKKSIQVFIKNSTMFQDNFPEMVHKMYIINASVYFTTIWPVIQKCIGPALKEKISVYGQDGWKEELLRIIDADVLPAFLGGNRTDPDGNPLCLNSVCHCGPVPEKYFLDKYLKSLSQKSGVKSAKIERQGRIMEYIHITDSNSIINWEFELRLYDIGFGLLLESTSDVTEELIPIHAIETEYEPYSGMYRCKNPGKYVIVFDNSHSWFHSKEIYYRTWVTNGDSMKPDYTKIPLHKYLSM